MLIMLGVAVVLDAIGYLFWSYIFSRFVFRADLPLPRAAKCAVAAYATGWLLYFALTMGMRNYPGFASGEISLIGLLPGIVAAALVFLWEWRSFARHWTPDEDIAEVFE